jgi:hypothetical protein
MRTNQHARDWRKARGKRAEAGRGGMLVWEKKGAFSGYPFERVSKGGKSKPLDYHPSHLLFRMATFVNIGRDQVNIQVHREFSAFVIPPYHKPIA